MPAHAGIQNDPRALDAGLRRHDKLELQT